MGNLRRPNNMENKMVELPVTARCHFKPAYKPKYERYRAATLYLAILLTITAFAFGWALNANLGLKRDNAALRQGFDEHKGVITIKGDK
jgi:hypothetical protein